jgi:hypothetical protein
LTAAAVSDLVHFCKSRGKDHSQLARIYEAFQDGIRVGEIACAGGETGPTPGTSFQFLQEVQFLQEGRRLMIGYSAYRFLPNSASNSSMLVRNDGVEHEVGGNAIYHGRGAHIGIRPLLQR